MTTGVNHSVILLSSFLVISSIFNNKTGAQDKVSYDGYIAMDVRSEHGKEYVDLFSKAKIEFKLDLEDHIRAVIDIRGNSNDPEIELKEVHALFKCDPKFRMKIGNIKRCFGIEEMISQEDLYTIEESHINAYMSPFGYVGRAPGTQVYKEYDGKGPPRSYYLQASSDQSYNVTLNGRISHHNLCGSWCLGLDGVYQRTDLDQPPREYPPNTYAVSIDLSRQTGLFYTDLEAFFGLDPIETQLSDFSGEDRDVVFTGLKWLLAQYWRIDGNLLEGVEPLFLSSILVPDTKYMNANRIEILLGLNVYLYEDVRLRFNGDLILANSKHNLHDRTLAAGSKVSSELQLKW